MPSSQRIDSNWSPFTNDLDLEMLLTENPFQHQKHAPLRHLLTYHVTLERIRIWPYDREKTKTFFRLFFSFQRARLNSSEVNGCRECLFFHSIRTKSTWTISPHIVHNREIIWIYFRVETISSHVRIHFLIRHVKAKTTCPTQLGIFRRGGYYFRKRIKLLLNIHKRKQALSERVCASWHRLFYTQNIYSARTQIRCTWVASCMFEITGQWVLRRKKKRNKNIDIVFPCFIFKC